MQIRTLSRKNTITSLNNLATLNTSTKLAFKSQEDLIQKNNHISKINLSFKNHHAFQNYIRGTIPSQSDFKKFVSFLYRGVKYSLKSLKGPSNQHIRKKKIKLIENKGSKSKKILFMDLDQTLIHTQYIGSSKFDFTDVQLTVDGTRIHFNMRPHCLQFLRRMSKHYNIYVFTAGTYNYAKTIIEYLNKQDQLIIDFLHRQNCMQTNNGYQIKDLRIVSNRQLKDIILVDNLVHSFGLQIQNGIPILDFLDNKEDKQLLGLQKILIEAATVSDVRQYLRQKIGLKKILNYSEEIYTKLDSQFNS